jgi:hypothetical protein
MPNYGEPAVSRATSQPDRAPGSRPAVACTRTSRPRTAEPPTRSYSASCVDNTVVVLEYQGTCTRVVEDLRYHGTMAVVDVRPRGLVPLDGGLGHLASRTRQGRLLSERCCATVGWCFSLSIPAGLNDQQTPATHHTHTLARTRARTATMLRQAAAVGTASARASWLRPTGAVRHYAPNRRRVKVVLLDDKISRKGVSGDVIEVRPGYARNKLIPQKLAKYATPENIALFGKKAREQQRVDATSAAAAAAAADATSAATKAEQAVAVAEAVGAEGEAPVAA